MERQSVITLLVTAKNTTYSMEMQVINFYSELTFTPPKSPAGGLFQNIVININILQVPLRGI
jgi:hypothetical protein